MLHSGKLLYSSFQVRLTKICHKCSFMSIQEMTSMVVWPPWDRSGRESRVMHITPIFGRRYTATLITVYCHIKLELLSSHSCPYCLSSPKFSFNNIILLLLQRGVTAPMHRVTCNMPIDWQNETHSNHCYITYLLNVFYTTNATSIYLLIKTSFWHMSYS